MRGRLSRRGVALGRAHAVMVTNFWLGNPLVVERHARAIMERYVQERHGQIVKSINYDPKTLAGIYLPLVLWMLGYPTRPWRLCMSATLTHAASAIRSTPDSS